MARVVIFSEDGKKIREISDEKEVKSLLSSIDVLFERWKVKDIPPQASQEDILEAYKEELESFKNRFNYQSIDAVSIKPDNPKKDEIRFKYLKEHTHDDFEVRFFVDGGGAFYLHINDKVYIVLCEKGDLISVPAGVKHWYDMGDKPDFKCIRIFTIPDGWVGNFTGSSIAESFPKYGEII